MVTTFFGGSGTGNWAQCLALKNIPYPFSFFILGWNLATLSSCPGCAQTCNPPSSASKSWQTIGVCHHAWLFFLNFKPNLPSWTPTHQTFEWWCQWAWVGWQSGREQFPPIPKMMIPVSWTVVDICWLLPLASTILSPLQNGLEPPFTLRDTPILCWSLTKNISLQRFITLMSSEITHSN